MRPGYVPPSRDVLSGRLLNQKTSRINKKINKVIKNSENLTLGKLNYYFFLYFIYLFFKFLNISNLII